MPGAFLSADACGSKTDMSLIVGTIYISNFDTDDFGIEAPFEIGTDPHCTL